MLILVTLVEVECIPLIHYTKPIMNMKNSIGLPVIGVLMLTTLLVACNGSSSSSGSSKDSAVAAGKTGAMKLVKQWETDTSVRAPESVLWDSGEKIFYVSNINGDGVARDNNGFISKLSPSGKITKPHWVNGLDAPKGMGMYNGELYVADIDSLVIIDIRSAEIKSKVFIPGSVFLNDIAVDKEGNVYISDTRKGKVFLYKEGRVSEYLSSPEVKGANGLLVWKNKLWIDAADGIYNYDFGTKVFTLFCDEVKGGDGLSVVNDSDLIASRWVGEVYYVHADGSAEKILDTKDQNANTADLFFLKDSNVLVIPTFKGNRVAGYSL